MPQVKNPTLATIKLSRRWGTRFLLRIYIFRLRLFAEVGVVFVDPVLAGWGEDIEVDAVGQGSGGVGKTAGDDEDFARVDGV